MPRGPNHEMGMEGGGENFGSRIPTFPGPDSLGFLTGVERPFQEPRFCF